MRSQSTRAKHKPGAQYRPTLINVANCRNDPVRFEEVDHVDEGDLVPEGLHLSSATLSDGSLVLNRDWVLFKLDNKCCIGHYLKSVGATSEIDACQSLGDNLYGWPCVCRQDTDPDYCVMLTCGSIRCQDLRYMPTVDIISKFNHPILTRRGFKIPLHILEKVV